MTDHKFEPGQLVLARYNVGGGATWSLQHFSHLTSGECPFNSITGYSFAQCIPYTTETAHLLGTSQPYEPPKPPQEYEWGQKVEVWSFANKWEQSVFVGRRADGRFMYILKLDEIVRIVDDISKIRPLPDDTAHLDAKP